MYNLIYAIIHKNPYYIIYIYYISIIYTCQYVNIGDFFVPKNDLLEGSYQLQLFVLIYIAIQMSKDHVRTETAGHIIILATRCCHFKSRNHFVYIHCIYLPTYKYITIRSILYRYFGAHIGFVKPM